MTTAVATAPATWFTVAGSNDLYWRVEMPAKALGAKVIKIPVAVGKQEIAYQNLTGHFRWFLDGELSRYPDLEGSAVFTRPDQARAIHAVAMSELGHRTVAELDDNYIADPKFNPFQRRRHDPRGSWNEEHLTALAAFDAVIFSTEWLRDRYAKAFKKLKRGNPALHVCRNHVDMDDWPVPIPREDDPLRIGWMGSASHEWDLKLAYPALRWASTAGHDVKLIGYDPHWFPHCRIKGQQAHEQIGFQHTVTEWTDDYGRPALPLDIGLAPLRRDDFTLAKSDVKFLEYTISGAATIASDTVYGETIVHGETGLIASSREDFWRYTQLLASDDNLRERLVANAQQYVRENRLIEQNVSEWREAICP